ncbi:MAG: hypothetical protein GY792_19015, partial [Gammaproteobacteria bacterium]|nr:hypothetical protein [Gammaproteobacteria bacterium]
MKHSKAAVRGKARPALDVRFEPQNLTSYSGLILFQHFFSLIGIKERLWGCFRHLKVSPIYSHHVILMLLIVHLIIGHRRLRDVDYYRDDEMVKRLLGLKRLPDVSTINRSLRSADKVSVEKVRDESRNLVTERLSAERLSRVTLDFDGSVLSIGRHAEGTAVGFNKKKKGARSYYPLKGMIDGRKRWRQLNGELSFFETRWKPKSWTTPHRFIFIRKQVRCQDKAPLQLDLFKPIEYGYEFKVIVTNKSGSPRRVVAFHEGRGSQEGIFAELKSHCQMDYVPVTTRAGNQLYMFAGILAHNLTRELQIQVTPRTRGTTAKRAA